MSRSGPAEADPGGGSTAAGGVVRQNGSVDEEDITKQLRGAVYRRDTPAILDTLRAAGLAARRLQMAGLGLLTALADDRAAAEPLARSLVRALTERGWDGDEELAAELTGALGTGPVPALTDVPVRLSELASAMDTSNYGGRIDLRHGTVYPAADFGFDDFGDEEGEEDEEDDDRDRWLGIEPSGSRTGWNDMAAFIDTVSDPGRADRLTIAIEGRGAFRRFKDVLHRWPGEAARWYAFSEDRQLGRAREFLAAEGYRASGY